MTEQEEFEFRDRMEKERLPKEPTFGEKAGAGLYGAAVGLGGGLGELEKFGAYTVPEFLGLREKDQQDQFMGRETIFPTGKEVEKGLSKLGFKPPREEVSGYKTAGEIIGGFGTALPSMVRGGAKLALGAPSMAKEATAKTAEKLGFKLSPSQVRRDVPAAAKGATFNAPANQTLANKLASASTGKEVAEITPTFVRDRLKTLGGEFDKVYKDRIFNIDTNAVQALDAIRTFETQLPASVQLASVRNAADKIVKSFSTLASRTGAQPQTFAIEGNALQTIRNDLMSAARSATDRSDAHRLYELIDAIDGSIARNHPDVAETLNKLRPLYRNSVILEDLIRQKGIRGGDISLESLGNMLGAQKQAVRRVGGELDQLGEIGRELQLRARWQKETDDVGLTDLLRTGMGKAASGLGLRSRPARAVQRFYATEPTSTLGRVAREGVTPYLPEVTRQMPRVGEVGVTARKLPAATAAGTALRPFQQEE